MLERLNEWLRRRRIKERMRYNDMLWRIYHNKEPGHADIRNWHNEKWIKDMISGIEDMHLELYEELHKGENHE